MTGVPPFQEICICSYIWMGIYQWSLSISISQHVAIYEWHFSIAVDYMEVSWNRGTPSHHPFWLAFPFKTNQLLGHPHDTSESLKSPFKTHQKSQLKPMKSQFFDGETSILTLVGGWATPLKHMKVNWDDYSQYMGFNNIDVPNHQPAHVNPNWNPMVSRKSSPGSSRKPGLGPFRQASQGAWGGQASRQSRGLGGHEAKPWLCLGNDEMFVGYDVCVCTYIYIFIIYIYYIYILFYIMYYILYIIYIMYIYDII